LDSPSIGSVVLLPFPFSDLSKAKVRPAVVLAGGLRVPSFTRPSKLFTANGSIFLSSAGRLGRSKRSDLLNRGMGLFLVSAEVG
jgi:hypothetical protein